jgi:hypothetical protein
MIRISASARRYLVVPVVALAITSAAYLDPTAAEMLDGLTQHLIELPCDVLRGFQSFSLDRNDPTDNERLWLLSPTLEAL